MKTAACRNRQEFIGMFEHENPFSSTLAVCKILLTPTQELPSWAMTAAPPGWEFR